MSLRLFTDTLHFAIQSICEPLASTSQGESRSWRLLFDMCTRSPLLQRKTEPHSVRYLLLGILHVSADITQSLHNHLQSMADAEEYGPRINYVVFTLSVAAKLNVGNTEKLEYVKRKIQSVTNKTRPQFCNCYLSDWCLTSLTRLTRRAP